MSQEPIDRGRTTSDRDVNFGATVYDAEGEKLGEVRGFDEHGFYVTATEGVEGLPLGHDRTEGTLGEADLMWGCWRRSFPRRARPVAPRRRTCTTGRRTDGRGQSHGDRFRQSLPLARPRGGNSNSSRSGRSLTL